MIFSQKNAQSVAAEQSSFNQTLKLISDKVICRLAVHLLENDEIDG